MDKDILVVSSGIITYGHQKLKELENPVTYKGKFKQYIRNKGFIPFFIDNLEEVAIELNKRFNNPFFAHFIDREIIIQKDSTAKGEFGIDIYKHIKNLYGDKEPQNFYLMCEEEIFDEYKDLLNVHELNHLNLIKRNDVFKTLDRIID